MCPSNLRPHSPSGKRPMVAFIGLFRLLGAIFLLLLPLLLLMKRPQAGGETAGAH